MQIPTELTHRDRVRDETKQREKRNSGRRHPDKHEQTGFLQSLTFHKNVLKCVRPHNKALYSVLRDRN